MIKSIILLAIIIVSLFSCQKEIKYTGDNGSSFLVVNGLIENDSIIRISLSKSTPAIGEQATGSSDINSQATLTLTDNSTSEVFTSTTVDSQGFYQFGTTAKIGHSYSISISHPDFPVAAASTSLPQNIPISDWDSTSFDKISKFGGEVIKEKRVTLHWQDPDGENKYAIKVFSVDTVTGVENALFPRIPDFSSKETSQDGKISLFADESFNNTSMSLDITFEKEFYSGGIDNVEKSYRIILYNMTNEVFNYVVSTNKQIKNGNSPFSEPVKVYTNITNGLGIFGGMGNTNLKIK